MDPSNWPRSFLEPQTRGAREAPAAALIVSGRRSTCTGKPLSLPMAEVLQGAEALRPFCVGAGSKATASLGIGIWGHPRDLTKNSTRYC